MGTMGKMGKDGHGKDVPYVYMFDRYSTLNVGR